MIATTPEFTGLPSFRHRVLLSVAVLVGLVVALTLTKRSDAILRERFDARIVDVIAAAWTVGFVAVAGYLILVLWEAGPMLSDVLEQFGNPYVLGGQVFLTLAVAATAYVFTGIGHRAIHELADGRQGVSRHEAEVVYRVSQVGIYLLAGTIVLGVWQVDLSGLLVGAGFLGIVLGMAARQTLGSVVAGFVVMFSRPFEIGDWVRIGDNEGIVTDITVVNTRLQTFDGEYVMLPNDLVSSNEIVNRSRKGRLRIGVEVGVDYATDVDRAVEVTSEALADVDEILSVPRPQVVLDRFGDSAIVLEARFWIDKPSARRRWRAQTRVIRAIKRHFDDEGIKIPYPQRELSGRPEAGGFRVTGDRPVDREGGHGAGAENDGDGRDGEDADAAVVEDDDD